MPKHNRDETVAFAAGHMKKNPEIEMSELKNLGKPLGYNIYPLIIGYARKALGLKRATPKPRKAGKRGPGRPPGKRGPGRPPGRRGPGRPPGHRGPGRPRKAMDMSAGLAGIAAHMRDLEREVTTLRAALAKIGDLASKD